MQAKESLNYKTTGTEDTGLKTPEEGAISLLCLFLPVSSPPIFLYFYSRRVRDWFLNIKTSIFRETSKDSAEYRILANQIDDHSPSYFQRQLTAYQARNFDHDQMQRPTQKIQLQRSNLLLLFTELC